MKLNDAQIDQKLENFPDWHRDGDRIVRDFHFENFKMAMAFVNRVADLAEWVNHHPDILVHSWNRVHLSIHTHDAGGLTDKDFDLARQINLFA
jgi:4a-hydroxytetrahydrobiopterin dehydratase